MLPVPPPLKKKQCLGNFEAPVAGFENVVTVGKGFRSIGNLLVHGCIASGTQRRRGLDGAGSLWVPEMELRRCGGTGGESLQLGGWFQSCPPPYRTGTRHSINLTSETLQPSDSVFC